MNGLLNLLPSGATSFLAMDRVAFTIFGRDIYWYGIIIASAMIAAIIVALVICKIKKISLDTPITIAAIILPTGILMGRLFSVLLEKDLSIADYFRFETGGMSIIGAIIGGGLGLLLYVLIKKPKRPLVYFDILVTVLFLAQSIGRWGNFVNQEVYGQMIEAGSTFAKFPFAVEINGNFYEALFFYESMLDLLGFIITLVVFLTVKDDGWACGIYGVFYGTIRSVLETRRQSQYVLKIFNMPASLIVSVILIAIGVSILTYKVVKLIKNRKEKVSDGK